MVEMLVIVWLTFMDGSVVQYKTDDGQVPTVAAESGNEGLVKCKAEIDKILTEMREDFRDYDPKPSSFMTGCAQKQEE